MFKNLDHNFWNQNPSRSLKVTKDLDCSLVSNKNFRKYYHLTVGTQGQVKLAKVA